MIQATLAIVSCELAASPDFANQANPLVSFRMSNPNRSRCIPPGAPTLIGHSEEDLPPDAWAHYLLSAEWTKGAGLILELQTKSPQRELQTRLKTVEETHHMLGDLRFVASALVQVVGFEAKTACTCCQRGLGPWPGCKVLPGLLDGVCANCQNRNRQKCSLRESNPINTECLKVSILTFSASWLELAR